MRNGIAFRRTPVGDKYVSEAMIEEGALIGGEASGHIIFRAYQNTGDGLLTSLIMCVVERERGLENLDDRVEYPSASCNIDTDAEGIKRFDDAEVKGFIEKHDKITGDFVKLPGIKDETATKLINDILLQLDSKAVQAVIKTMPVKIKLLALSKDIPESNMLLFISDRKICYENGDLKNLINKPGLLYEYVRVYSQDILDNFDNVMPTNPSQELIAFIVSDEKIDVELRKKVVAHYSNYIKISDFAQKYAEFILEGNSVSTSILWQFSAENIDTETKLQILTICNYGGVLPDNDRLKEYIMSLGESYKAMYDRKLKETRVSNTKENKQLLDFLKDNHLIISYHKAPKQEQYIAKIANVV